MSLSDAIRSILACPVCGGALEEVEAGAKCAVCGVTYPIREDVLDFLPPPSHDSDP